MTTEIETNVAKPRKPRARKPKAEKNTSVKKLIEALKFAATVQKKAGSVEQQFCALTNNWLVANNGIIMLATKIEENLNTCPHTHQLLEALKETGEDVNITQLTEQVLSVKSGNFKALIPCCQYEELGLPLPDVIYTTADNRLKNALEAVMCLATEGAEQAHLAAVKFQTNSVMATNSHAVLEAWHGFDLPGEYLLPKAAVVAVVKHEKALVGIGYGEASVTFHFEDESLIKTQLYQATYPDCSSFLELQTNEWPLPDEFFKAVSAVESFSDNGLVFFENGVVASREIETEATTYKIDGLPDGMAFNAKYLMLVKHVMKDVRFDKENNRVLFFNGNVRGVLLGVTRQETYAPITETVNGEDLPF